MWPSPSCPLLLPRIGLGQNIALRISEAPAPAAVHNALTGEGEAMLVTTGLGEWNLKDPESP